MHRLNLIPVHRRQERRRRLRIQLWVGCVAVWSILLTGVSFATHAAVRASSDDPAAQVERVRSRVQETRSHLLGAEKRARRITLDLEANSLIADQPDWSVLLHLLGEICGDEVAFDSVQLTPGRPVTATDAQIPTRGPFSLEVTGISLSQTTVSAFVLRLEHCGVFDEVALANTSRLDGSGRSLIRFTIQCELSETTRTGETQ